ncbi:MAG: 6-carboxytetrahydropterin synthase QueD [bacterium]|nr:6-carboxytetrahydropterin synthase QueD [bacterium]
MYILTIEDHFASAHQLRGYQGKCENLHGHNWKVVLSVKGTKLDPIGLLIDFKDLKTILKSTLDELDHKNINETPPFTDINPSSENIAQYLSEKIGKIFSADYPHVEIESVTVWESHTARCKYIP